MTSDIASRTTALCLGSNGGISANKLGPFGFQPQGCAFSLSIRLSLSLSFVLAFSQSLTIALVSLSRSRALSLTRSLFSFSPSISISLLSPSFSHFMSLHLAKCSCSHSLPLLNKCVTLGGSRFSSCIMSLVSRAPLCLWEGL